jgi:P-type E1-E2 ATPase
MTKTISVSVLKHGDLVLVRPRASVPADGNVVDGFSNVKESTITGESKPVHKLSNMKKNYTLPVKANMGQTPYKIRCLST